MNPRRTAACGKGTHGKPSPPAGVPVCNDGSVVKRKRLRNVHYCVELSEWATFVGSEWVHERDLVEAPLCIR